MNWFFFVNCAACGGLAGAKNDSTAKKKQNTTEPLIILITDALITYFADAEPRWSPSASRDRAGKRSVLSFLTEKLGRFCSQHFFFLNVLQVFYFYF